MVSSDIEFAVAILLPVVILVFLRINAAVVFLSLCLGYVLVQFVSGDANSLMNFIEPHSGSFSASSVRLVMLFGPAILTAVIMMFSIKGHLRAVFNVLPAAGVAALAVLLSVPLLAPGLRYNIESQAVWQHVSRAQDLIVGFSAVISLLALWTQRRNAEHLEHGHHHR